MKHTARNWTAQAIRKEDYLGDEFNFVVGTAHHDIAFVYSEPEAKHIVKACNSYEALLEACKAVYNYRNTSPQCRGRAGFPDKQIERAIAKADS